MPFHPFISHDGLADNFCVVVWVCFCVLVAVGFAVVLCFCLLNGVAARSQYGDISGRYGWVKAVIFV